MPKGKVQSISFSVFGPRVCGVRMEVPQAEQVTPDLSISPQFISFIASLLPSLLRGRIELQYEVCGLWPEACVDGSGREDRHTGKMGT